jgi:hypothetical protein
MVAQAVSLFWLGLSARLRRAEVYAVCRLCRGYWCAAAVRYLGGLGNADMFVVRPGRFSVGDSRDAAAKSQEELCGIGSLSQCSGPRGCLLRVVGAILGIPRVHFAFDLVWNHSGTFWATRAGACRGDSGEKGKEETSTGYQPSVLHDNLMLCVL